MLSARLTAANFTFIFQQLDQRHQSTSTGGGVNHLGFDDDVVTVTTDETEPQVMNEEQQKLQRGAGDDNKYGQKGKLRPVACRKLNK